MNKIIEQRIQQLITTKFLKTESEINSIVLSMQAIERDVQKIHGKSVINDKQIETKQIHTLNRIHKMFSSGFLFLQYFNAKTNNSPFGKLNTMKIMSIVNDIENLNSAELSSYLNRSSTNIKKQHSKKRNFRKNETKQAKKEINVTYK